ncbi:hypothetical protein SteCoe_12111 [Stentor coeruleus]|uniref:ELMO domain-containing protein n=1 Tax=Stentor coeruleus TaxID=5963 RepID=A0A1R2CBI7_9CILI|nr:hypothetical protein SteCoe_12111 [Stentor coeruleus]
MNSKDSSRKNSNVIDVQNLESERSSSSSPESSSCSIEIIQQKAPTGPAVFNFGGKFKLPIVNTSNVSKPDTIYDKNKNSGGKIVGDSVDANRKIQYEHGDSFSSIDSKPSVRMRPDSDFAYAIPSKQVNIPKNLIKMPSMKYKNPSSSSSSSSSSSIESLSKSEKSSISSKEIKSPKNPKSPITTIPKILIPVSQAVGSEPKVNLEAKIPVADIVKEEKPQLIENKNKEKLSEESPIIKNKDVLEKPQVNIHHNIISEKPENVDVKSRSHPKIPPLALPGVNNNENQKIQPPKLLGNDPRNSIKVQGPGEAKGNIDFDSEDASQLDQSSSFIAESHDEISDDLFGVENPSANLKVHHNHEEIHDKKHLDHNSPNVDIKIHEVPHQHHHQNIKPGNIEEIKHHEHVGINIEIPGNIDNKKHHEHIGINIEIPGNVDNKKHPSRNSGSQDIIIDLENSVNHAFMFSARMLSFGQIIGDLTQTPYISKNLWITNSCMQSFCKCFLKGSDLTNSQEQNTFRLIDLGLTKFNNDTELHRNIMMSYYTRYYNKMVFEDTPIMWKILGFSTPSKDSNEMSAPGILLTILHLIFMFENCVAISRGIIMHATSQPNFPFILVLQNLMKYSLDLIRRKKFNDAISRSAADNFVFQIFFEYQSGIVAQWVEIYNENKDIDYATKRTIGAANRNPELMRGIYQNARK